MSAEPTELARAAQAGGRDRRSERDRRPAAVGSEHDDAAGRRRRARGSVRGARADRPRPAHRPRARQAARRARAVGGVGRPRRRRRRARSTTCAATITRRSTSRPTSRRRSPAPTPTPSRPGWRRARRATSSSSSPRSSACSSSPHRYIACFDGTRRVRAPLRRPARRLRAEPHDRRAARDLRARSRRSSSRSSRPPPRRARTGACSPATSRRSARRRSRTSCSRAVGYDPEFWRLDPSVHPFARSMAHTDVRLTTRWEEDDLAMAFYSCLHEFGHGLYEAQMDPRHYRTTLAEADGARRPRVPVAAVGEPRRPLEAVLRVGPAASCASTSDGPFEAIEVPRALPQRQPGPAQPGPDRGRRDDVQPAHRAAVRARAGAGRGAPGRQGPARRLGRGDAPPARARDAVAARRASCRTSTGARG